MLNIIQADIDQSVIKPSLDRGQSAYLQAEDIDFKSLPITDEAEISTRSDDQSFQSLVHYVQSFNAKKIDTEHASVKAMKRLLTPFMKDTLSAQKKAEQIHALFSPLIQKEEQVSLEQLSLFEASVMSASLMDDSIQVAVEQHITAFNQLEWGIHFSDKVSERWFVMGDREAHAYTSELILKSKTIATTKVIDKKDQRREYPDILKLTDNEKTLISRYLSQLFSDGYEGLSAMEIVLNIYDDLRSGNLLKYSSDSVEHWKRIDEIFQTRQGDCEEFANVQASLTSMALKQAGFDEESLSVSVLGGQFESNTSGLGHAFMVYTDNKGQQWVLDSSHGANFPGLDQHSSTWFLLEQYQSLYGFNTYFQYDERQINFLVSEEILDGFSTGVFESVSALFNEVPLLGEVPQSAVNLFDVVLPGAGHIFDKIGAVGDNISHLKDVFDTSKYSIDFDGALNSIVDETVADLKKNRWSITSGSLRNEIEKIEGFVLNEVALLQALKGQTDYLESSDKLVVGKEAFVHIAGIDETASEKIWKILIEISVLNQDIKGGDASINKDIKSLSDLSFIGLQGLERLNITASDTALYESKKTEIINFLNNNNSIYQVKEQFFRDVAKLGTDDDPLKSTKFVNETIYDVILKQAFHKEKTIGHIKMTDFYPLFEQGTKEEQKTGTVISISISISVRNIFT